jgi:hypothetical protein
VKKGETPIIPSCSPLWALATKKPQTFTEWEDPDIKKQNENDVKQNENDALSALADSFSFCFCDLVRIKVPY